MRCEVLTDAGDFWRLSSAFLLADPVVNHVILTTIATRREQPEEARAGATFAAVLDGSGAVVGAAMRTPPYEAYLSPMPLEAVDTLVEALLGACPDNAGIGGIGGTVTEADAFAGAWARRTGARVELRMHQRIHRLDAPSQPAPPAGGWRRAGPADLDLLSRWSEAFELEAEGHTAGRAAAAIGVAGRIAGGRAFLWEAGDPVCYAGRTSAHGGVVRIGPVYTPPEHRRHGYAAALVFAVGESAVADGASRLVLYTDLGNATANHVYHRIGYRPVADVVLHTFSAGPA